MGCKYLYICTVRIVGIRYTIWYFDFIFERNVILTYDKRKNDNIIIYYGLLYILGSNARSS